MITAKDPAKEKFSKFMMTVEEKKRFRASRTVDIKAVSEVAGL